MDALCLSCSTFCVLWHFSFLCDTYYSCPLTWKLFLVRGFRTGHSFKYCTCIMVLGSGSQEMYDPRLCIRFNESSRACSLAPAGLDNNFNLRFLYPTFSRLGTASTHSGARPLLDLTTAQAWLLLEYFWIGIGLEF